MQQYNYYVLPGRVLNFTVPLSSILNASIGNFGDMADTNAIYSSLLLFMYLNYYFNMLSYQFYILFIISNRISYGIYLVYTNTQRFLPFNCSSFFRKLLLSNCVSRYVYTFLELSSLEPKNEYKVKITKDPNMTTKFLNKVLVIFIKK